MQSGRQVGAYNDMYGCFFVVIAHRPTVPECNSRWLRGVGVVVKVYGVDLTIKVYQTETPPVVDSS